MAAPRESLSGAIKKEQMNAKEMEQMELLEHRFHALVAQHGKVQAGACDTICHCFYEVIRSIPWCSILALLPCLAGAYIMRKNQDFVKQAMGDMDFGAMKQVNDHIGCVDIACIIVVVIDIVAVLAAFSASGDTREYIFGHEEHGFMLCLQVLAGPVLFISLLVILSLLFLALFLGNFVTLPSTTLMAVASAACKLGNTEVIALVASLQGMSKGGGLNATSVQNSISAFCEDEHEVLSRGCGFFALGLALATLGQVWILTMHANCLEQVMSQEDLEDVEDEAKVKEYYENHNYGATL